MLVVQFILRAFGLIFHLLLAMFLFAISALAWGTGQHTLQLGMLPWQGSALTMWLFFSGLAGIAITVLAAKRVLPVLFVLWSLAVAVMVVRGYFFSSYSFGGRSIDLALYLTAGSLVALIGSIYQARPQRPAKRDSLLASAR